jgi:hypothetical protein
VKKKSYRAPDGTEWGVQVMLPGSSNAMVVFRHPDGASSHNDRYNWFISTGPEARNVTTRLSPEDVLAGLKDATIATLFSRSMAISRPPIPAKDPLGL